MLGKNAETNRGATGLITLLGNKTGKISNNPPEQEERGSQKNMKSIGWGISDTKNGRGKGGLCIKKKRPKKTSGIVEEVRDVSTC